MVPSVQLPPSSRLPMAQSQIPSAPRPLQPQPLTTEGPHAQADVSPPSPETVQSKPTQEEKDAMPTLNLSEFSSVSLDLDVSRLRQDASIEPSKQDPAAQVDASLVEEPEKTKSELTTASERGGESGGSLSETKGDRSTSDLKRTRPESDNELGSDLDDSDDDIKEGEDESINDLILCQYEKISRVRTRWRGVLRAGIIHIGQSDYCFSRANADLDW